MNHSHVDAHTIQALYMKSQEAVVALKVELQKARTECARLTHDALILRDQNRRLLDDQEQLTLARRDAEGKLRFRTRQVMELEQDRTGMIMKESDLKSRIEQLEVKWTSMCKELNDAKTEMKVLTAKNEVLEESAAEAAHQNSVPFDAYRRMEVETESLKATIKDLTEINRIQGLKLQSELKHIQKFHREANNTHPAAGPAENSSSDYKHRDRSNAAPPAAPSSGEKSKPHAERSQGTGTGTAAEHKPHVNVHSQGAPARAYTASSPPAPAPAPAPASPVVHIPTVSEDKPTPPPAPAPAPAPAPKAAPVKAASATSKAPTVVKGPAGATKTTKTKATKAKTKSKSSGLAPLNLRISVEKEELSSAPVSPMSQSGESGSSFAPVAGSKPSAARPKAKAAVAGGAKPKTGLAGKTKTKTK